ncbi:hypothetical protein ACIQ1D_20745 [Lysinibacillus xylanilyticus]
MLEERIVHYDYDLQIEAYHFHGIMRKVTKEITGKEYFAYSG